MYYAKSAGNDCSAVLCKDHLLDVADLAEKFGEEVGLAVEARLCGQVHDFGKYSDMFADVLRGKAVSVDHAVPSAVFLNIGAKHTSRPDVYRSLVECVAGHHNGLQCFDLFKNLLKDALEDGCQPLFGLSGKRLSLEGLAQYKAAMSAFYADFSKLIFPSLSEWDYAVDSQLDKMVQVMLRTRMLFSCLVDADYSASAEESSSGYLSWSEGSSLDVTTALRALSNYRSAVQKGSTANTVLNQVRNNVYSDCETAGDGADDLMTLTAPTGAGKTLALLNLALHKCVANDLRPAKRRIIVILPFLSLSDQTVDIYRKILPDVLVDNSQADLSDEQRELASRWSAFCIVTTTVQFFESLFSNRPGDCRKLHNIANSVVIFDEAQSLPLGLSRLTMYAMRELVNRYNVSVVLSTATQPAYQYMPDLTWNPVEISKHVSENFAAVKRTEIHWDLVQRTDFDVIADRMSVGQNVCCIVNLKRHAVVLYEKLRQRVGEQAVFVSTDLCPAHRRAVIERIRCRQKECLPVYVVSTQCIEAGIDLDFDELYRELAPLEAIVQAAGRCNRNGRLATGNVHVFIPDDDKCYPDDNYEHHAMLVKMMVPAGIDINDSLSIESYYKRVYTRFSEDDKKLVLAFEGRDYEAVSDGYRLIQSRGRQIVVPYDKNLYQEAILTMDTNSVSRKLMRKLMPIMVSTYVKSSVIEQHCQELMMYNRRLGLAVPTGTYVLLPGHEDYYASDIGLHLEKFEGGIFI